MLRDVLKAHLVDAGVNGDVPAAYSVRIEEARNGTRPKHLLFRGGTTVVRARSIERLVHGLIRHLDDHIDNADDVRVRASALITPQGVAVLTSLWRRPLNDVEPALARRGIAIVDSWTVPITEAGEVRVAPTGVTVNPGALPDDTSGREPRLVRDRYRVAAWMLPSAPTTRAGAVADAFGLVDNRDAVGAQRTLEALAATLEGALVVGTPQDTTAGMRQAILDLVAQAR